MNDTKARIPNSRMEATSNNVMIKYSQQSIDRIRQYYIDYVTNKGSHNEFHVKDTSKKDTEVK